MRNMHHESVNVEPHTGSRIKKLTPAGAWLVRHRRVPTSLATVIAELAFPAEARRHG